MDSLPPRDTGLGPALSPSSRQQPAVASLQSWAFGMQADCMGGARPQLRSPEHGFSTAVPTSAVTEVWLRTDPARAWALTSPSPPPSPTWTASLRTEARPTPVGPGGGCLGGHHPVCLALSSPEPQRDSPLLLLGQGKGLQHLTCLKAWSTPIPASALDTQVPGLTGVDRPWCVGRGPGGCRGSPLTPGP